MTAALVAEQASKGLPGARSVHIEVDATSGVAAYAAGSPAAEHQHHQLALVAAAATPVSSGMMARGDKEGQLQHGGGGPSPHWSPAWPPSSAKEQRIVELRSALAAALAERDALRAQQDTHATHAQLQAELVVARDQALGWRKELLDAQAQLANLVRADRDASSARTRLEALQGQAAELQAAGREAGAQVGGCLPSFLFACLPACCPACVPACLPSCLYACMPAWVPACVPALNTRAH
jgi:hypothetical protein